MQEIKVTYFRALGVLHVLLGFLLLPLSMFFGLPFMPITMVGLVWFMYLGVRLWRPNARIGRLLRRTHYVSGTLAVLLCAYGLFALRAAERSAAEGGGLLGAYGYLPLALGILLGCSAALSLWMARSLRGGNYEA